MQSGEKKDETPKQTTEAVSLDGRVDSLDLDEDGPELRQYRSRCQTIVDDD